MSDEPEPTSAPGATSAAAELTIDEARELLEQHVRTTPWGWRGLSKRLHIESFERSGAFDVIFKSFLETRTVTGNYHPYRGGPVDGPENGLTPGAWEIPLPLPGTFIDARRVLTLPHTQRVETCHVCNGRGEVTCGRCGGDGRHACGRCGGDGRVTNTRNVESRDAQGNVTTRTETYTESCGTCGGDGRVRCDTCAGRGLVTCSTCAGLRELLHFQELHVHWSTRTASVQIEKTALPDHLVGMAEGVAVLREEDARIEPGRGGAGGGAGPYRGAPVRVNADVEATANGLIASHTFGPNDKLHRQRLVVRAVPVFEARYRFRKEVRSFWIYGTDRHVHAPGYPLSPLRVGGAIGGSLLSAAGVAVALVTGGPPPRSVSAVEAPPQPAVMTAPPEPPPPPPEPPPPPPLRAAAGPRPKAPAGKSVVEVRTDPAGMEVLLGAKKLGLSPLFVTIDAKPRGRCTGGTCSGGVCVVGTCQPVTTLRLRHAGAERTVQINPSDGDPIEVRPVE